MKKTNNRKKKNEIKHTSMWRQQKLNIKITFYIKSGNGTHCNMHIYFRLLKRIMIGLATHGILYITINCWFVVLHTKSRAKFLNAQNNNFSELNIKC